MTNENTDRDEYEHAALSALVDRLIHSGDHVLTYNRHRRERRSVSIEGVQAHAGEL